MGGEGELAEGDDSEGVGEDVVGLYEGMAFAVEGEIPVELAVVTVALEKFGALYGGVEPFLAGFDFVVEGGEHPYFAALEPDEFVGVEDCSVAFEAGEVASVLGVDTVLEPEGHNAVEEFALVLSGELAEVYHISLVFMFYLYMR